MTGEIAGVGDAEVGFFKFKSAYRKLLFSMKTRGSKSHKGLLSVDKLKEKAGKKNTTQVVVDPSWFTWNANPAIFLQERHCSAN